jgi:hypothetical protein
MTKLRNIEAMKLPLVEKVDPKSLGPRPELKWVAPTDLLVDGAYQRDLSPASVGLIRRIAAEFAWSRVKPPVAVRVNGGYHVVDGQHTAIAAASIGLAQLPIFLVEASEVVDRARAFVSHNRNRIAITALNIHSALVAGGDPLSRTIQKVCDEIGVEMVGAGMGRIDVGVTQSVSTVVRLFKRHGAEVARKTLSSLVRAKVGPITEAQITAASALVRGGCSVERLVAAIRIGPPPEDLRKAQTSAAAAGERTWQALARIWERRTGSAAAAG